MTPDHARRGNDDEAGDAEELDRLEPVLRSRTTLGLTTGLRFVVTGTGRSGTGYIARVLSAPGVPTGHEEWFGAQPGVWGHQTVDRSTVWQKVKAPGSRLRVEFRRRTAGLVGDSSWLAVPHLQEFRGLVFLQVRHPLKVIGSLVGMDFFGPSHAEDPYRRYVERHFEVTGNVLADSARFWVEWNRRVLPFARRIWRLEDLNASLLEQVLGDLDVPDAEDRAATAADCIRPMNTAAECGFDPEEVLLDDVPDSIREELAGVAKSFGYDF